MSLVDDWMPEPDVASRHSTTVHAGRETVYAHLLGLDFGRIPLVAALMAVRAIPALLSEPRVTWRRMRAEAGAARLPLRALLGADFTLLQEAPPEELVLGLTGRFWTPTGGLVPTARESFRDAPPAGIARATWSFRLDALTPGVTLLHTETRVRCADPATLRNFRRYWRVIAPGSGLIRRAILRAVRRRAERTAA